jgi:hypothetical protein
MLYIDTDFHSHAVNGYRLSLSQQANSVSNMNIDEIWH